MKHKIAIILLFTFSLVFSACSKNKDQEIFSNVRIEGVLPSGTNYISITADARITDMNTKQTTTFGFYGSPVELKLLKGLYRFEKFEGTMRYTTESGTETVKAIYVEGVNASSFTIMEDEQTVTLQISITK